MKCIQLLALNWSRSIHPRNRHSITSSRVSFPLCTDKVAPLRYLKTTPECNRAFQTSSIVNPCPESAKKSVNSNCGFCNVNMCLLHTELRPSCYFTVKPPASNLRLLTESSSPLSKITSKSCELTLQTYISFVIFQWWECV